MSEETEETEETRRQIKEAAAQQLGTFAPAVLAYHMGYEQGRAQGIVAAVITATDPPAPPREGFTHAVWYALDDGEKVKILLARLNLGFGLEEIAEMLASLNGTSRRHVIGHLDSIFCMGCGDIQRIDERGDLDSCQCQNDI